MNTGPNLFSPSYPIAFEDAWRRYSYKRCSKPDSLKAWKQTELHRPDLPILFLCIDEYRIDIAKTKLHQAHFATWLRGHRWEGYLDEATLRFNTPKTATIARPAFRADQYPIPERPATRHYKDILAEAQTRKSQAQGT